MYSYLCKYSKLFSAQFTKIVKKVNNNSKIKIGDIIVKVDPTYFRPTEVENLLGDSSKARKLLRWKPKFDFDSLVDDMIKNDLEIAKKDLKVNS